jgi:hypothetical protein
MLKFEFPDPGIVGGVKLVTTPLGTPVAESVTTPSNPPVAVTVTTATPFVPCSMEVELGETDTLKPAATAAVTVRVTVVV